MLGAKNEKGPCVCVLTCSINELPTNSSAIIFTTQELLDIPDQVSGNHLCIPVFAFVVEPHRTWNYGLHNSGTSDKGPSEKGTASLQRTLF